ncbi:MAG: benzoate/H(+) symporter BenE family transporter [Rhodospirillales bacterium]|nr:MAG: benzoate/H(+) symporter BenE family transporter [Rhodospirillales bacterium]
MRVSVLSAAVVAVLVGLGGTLPLILAAAQASGASPAQTVSWLAGLALATAASTAILSLRHRIPIIAAWSTPGAALIAASATIPGMPAAVGAFLLAAGLIALTATLRPLSRLVDRIPATIAAAMLAGILLRLVIAMVDQVRIAPGLVLPMIAAFLVIRLVAPALAALVVLVGGAALAVALGLVSAPAGSLAPTLPALIAPAWDPATLIGVGVPLYLVTMASQNLPGYAVLRASGYEPPTRSILAVTGLASVATAFLGAHTTNLAAITAAICAGRDAHPDPARRWLTGPVYAACWALIAVFAGATVALFAALPAALLATVAGLALLGPMAGAAATALSVEKDRFAAVATLATTASGLTLFGVGSAFWGLCVGLLLVALERRPWR